MEDAAALVLRITVGSIFLAQGWPKAFGAPDVDRGRAGMTQLLAAKGLPLPLVLTWVVGIVEVVGGALVVVGLFTRIALGPLAVILVGAVVFVSWKRGFAGGWDWPFSVLGACVALFLLGSGAWSLNDLFGLNL